MPAHLVRYGGTRKEYPQHWIFDAHLLDKGWKEPRCETSCATRAFRSVKLTDEEMAKIAQEELERRTQGHGINTRIFYRDLWRFDSDFIAGTVSAEQNGIVDCIAGATATLVKDNSVVATTQTDAYGDFKFDRLALTMRPIWLEISAEDFTQKQAYIYRHCLSW